MLDHRHYLELAMEQAEIGFTEGSTPVGSVLVDANGGVVAVSRNQMAPLGDPTAHAEMMAIRAAGAPLMPRSLVPAPGAPDYTLYTTGEPCLMCVGLVLLSPIDTLVWAAGPIVLGGSAWDAIAGSGWNAARFERITVIREPDAEIRLRSRKLLYEFLTARGDHARAAIVRD
jgi:tRNA(Arg) A34 adenosine deaminase TadA